MCRTQYAVNENFPITLPASKPLAASATEALQLITADHPEKLSIHHDRRLIDISRFMMSRTGSSSVSGEAVTTRAAGTMTA